jgi:hypothetical protein
VAHRRRTGHHDRSRRVTADTQRPDAPWPHLQALIEGGGSISIGRIDPIPCAAVASDEGLIDLLNRLDVALDAAFAHDIYTDEINR